MVGINNQSCRGEMIADRKKQEAKENMKTDTRLKWKINPFHAQVWAVFNKGSLIELKSE